MFCSFNESKTILPFNRLNDDLFLQQPIWNNLYFIVNRKPLLFRNWLHSGIMYVKDLYDNDGNFHSIMHFQDIIVNKSNWLCEYKVLKNVFARFSPPDTWSCPTFGLACVLMSRPISPELVLSPDF